MSGIVSRCYKDLCWTLARQMGGLCPKFLGPHLFKVFFSFLWKGGTFSSYFFLGKLCLVLRFVTQV